ncbi:VWA domain-containing protein [Nakamurella sp. A5-74]|uniref:VWA domain-containing protein n=1 Tax=Nakamurella sp. A5-74 TaxID=3158264 RepID=A0AAU8DMD9_9ACTN
MSSSPPGPAALLPQRPVVHEADELLLGFARALRAAGVPVTADRERTMLEAVAAVGFGHMTATYLAARATLCGSPADLERYDQVFVAWFGGVRAGHSAKPPPATSVQVAPLDDGGGDGEATGESIHAIASATEVLRHRDVATMSLAERTALAGLFAKLVPRAPQRRAHRHTPAHRGRVDARATLREELRRMGEPGSIRRRRRGLRPRRIVLLIDVSGSMTSYADSLLRLAHRYVAGGAPVEVFTVGTRLTHVTRALRQMDPERALVAAGSMVPDWSGGTRLAQGLAIFLQRWGRRGLARGAVVVLFSDGWERDDPQALGEQVRRLQLLAHRVIWSNPHRGKDGYLPVQQGIVAALPFVDDFVSGHSMAAFEDLIGMVAHA